MIILVVELEQAEIRHGASMSKDNIQNIPTKIRIDHQPTCIQKEISPVFLQTSKESSFSQ